MDFYASHDLEDFISVLDGRNSICDEIADAPLELRGFLSDAASKLLKEPRFREALPGYLLPDSASQQLKKLGKIIAGDKRAAR
jgi:hypothetical protein